ncbi:MAG: hypothetical protein AAF703_11925 [Cyanobacteria bacterium P01_D01_bin.105]
MFKCNHNKRFSFKQTVARTLPIPLLLLSCLGAKANAQELRYQSVWSSGSGSNIVTEPLSRTDFIQQGQQLTSQGLRLVDVETERVNGRRIYSGVWVSGTGSNIFDGPLTGRAFRERREELRSQGLRLVDFEMFRANDGRVRFVGVWRSGSGVERLSRPRNAENFLALGEDLTAQGLRLVDVEVERINGELRYRGLWRSGSGSNLFTTPQPPAAFRELRDQMVTDGLELVDVERVGRPGNHRFVGVWASGNGESRVSRPRNFENFSTFGAQQTAEGLRTEDFEIFLTSGSSTPPGEGNVDPERPDEEPEAPEPTTVDFNDLPSWLDISTNEQYIVVDFSTFIDGQPRMTIPMGVLPPSAFNNDGAMNIPVDFCGLKIHEADTFTWQDGEEIIDNALYNQSNDIIEDYGFEYYSQTGQGLQFTGAIGQCATENNPWQFNYPLTENSGSGDNTLSDLRLVIEVNPGPFQIQDGSEVEFLYSN